MSGSMAERGGVSEGVSSLLVNYSSSSDSNDEETPPVVKKYKERYSFIVLTCT